MAGMAGGLGQELGQASALPGFVEAAVGAFLPRTSKATRAQHVCPHACCSAVLATLSHICVTCPLAAAVVAWVSATWGALTGAAGPPHSADLFLADDCRAWAPGRPLQGLWQRLRLACTSACWVHTGQRRHSQQHSSPGCGQPGAHAGRPPAGLGWWAGFSAGPWACCYATLRYAQRGIWGGTHGCAGKPSWSAGFTAGAMHANRGRGGPHMHWTITTPVPLPL